MGNHQRVGIMKLQQWGILKGSIPYGIIRRLMLLKVLHKPPRPIRVYMPKLGENHIEGKIMKFKHGGFSRVQYLMGLHGG
jgi:hypothetical protein